MSGFGIPELVICLGAFTLFVVIAMVVIIIILLVRRGKDSSGS